MTRLSYIICATPRAGTTLLCDLLASTGIAGSPASYYRRQSIPRWTERLGIPPATGPVDTDFERAYLAAVIKAGAGESDVFGVRLMWESRHELLARLSTLHPDESGDGGLMKSAFGDIAYIHLSRQDKVAQAISRLRAEQSGLWHVAADGSERERTGVPQPPDYDADRIDAFIRESRTHDAAWNTWFAEQGIDPIRLNYEDLAADPRAVLASLLQSLGLDASRADAVEIKTRKMADEESLDWAVRFGVERGVRR